MRPCSSAAFGISSNRTSIAEHRPGLPRLVARPPRPSPLCCPQRLLASMRRSSSPLVSEEWGRERERIGWDHRTRAAHRTGAALTAPPWAGTDDAVPRPNAPGCCWACHWTTVYRLRAGFLRDLVASALALSPLGRPNNPRRLAGDVEAGAARTLYGSPWRRLVDRHAHPAALSQHAQAGRNHQTAYATADAAAKTPGRRALSVHSQCLRTLPVSSERPHILGTSAFHGAG